MGQQNILYAGPMLGIEPRHPEPCMLSYGGVTCYPQPYNSHAILPPPGNRTTFDPRYLPENHGQLPYMITQYNGGVFPVPVNHDHLHFLNSNQFERTRSLFIDGSYRVFKRLGFMGFDFDPRLVHAVAAPWVAHGGPHLQAVSRNSPGFMHVSPMRPRHGPHNVYHPPPPLQMQNMDIHLQLPSTSHRHSTSANSYPFQNEADPGPRYMGPAVPHGVMVYEARRQPLMIDSIARHYSFPQLRILPADEQSGQFSNKDPVLSDDLVSNHVKTRIFASSKSSLADEEPNICVICQMDFEDQEKIRVLNCCHEYHVECIKKWINVKNNCPICKSTA
ncbi:uncharacterized protein LOC143615531 [Bidens hawaiensis]|uniref:uncharacterized protein LOC143615531 n=1 Tax=Bidens hawaiensis TaxID=980011 RepID=UPI00404B870C